MQEISTDEAPASIGPFSQGIKADGRVYVSGQGPVDPETSDIVGDTVQEQTERTLENIKAILEAGGTSLDNVVRAKVFLTDMDDYDGMNEVYGQYMSEPYPARACVGVAELPIDIRVEIEVVALPE